MFAVLLTVGNSVLICSCAIKMLSSAKKKATVFTHISYQKEMKFLPEKRNLRIEQI